MSCAVNLNSFYFLFGQMECVTSERVTITGLESVVVEALD